MPISKPPYPSEFRQQMVELVAAGRSPVQLAREFKCSEQSIHNWVARARADARKSSRNREVLSTPEREELARLRRENRQLKLERDILAKATAWFAVKGEKTFTGSSNS
jgi:transposase